MTRHYYCDRCGMKLKSGVWVYSVWTKSRYCTQLDACAKRARKKTRAAKRQQGATIAQA